VLSANSANAPFSAPKIPLPPPKRQDHCRVCLDRRFQRSALEVQGEPFSAIFSTTLLHTYTHETLRHLRRVHGQITLLFGLQAQGLAV